MRTYLTLDLYRVLGATEELSDAMKRLLTSKDTASMRKALEDMQKHMFDGLEREKKVREMEEAEELDEAGAADETEAPEAGDKQGAGSKDTGAGAGIGSDSSTVSAAYDGNGPDRIAVADDGQDEADGEDTEFINRPITPQQLDDVMSGERPYRSITVTLDKNGMIIRSDSSEPEHDYEMKFSEQLTNEFLIQMELLDIRKWDPMRYSPAYSGKNVCRWELDYNGLKGGEAVKSGFGTYPRQWPVLMELIDAFGDMNDMEQKPVHIAAGYATSLFAGLGKPGIVRKPGYALEEVVDDPDFRDASELAIEYSDSRLTQLIDMVHILSLMRVPEDVLAAGIVRVAALDRGYDEAAIRIGFDGLVADILEEYGEDWGLPEKERRIALIDKVKKSGSIYFKKLVFAEIMSMLVRVQAEMNEGEEFYDTAMTFEEMGLFYAEIIAALSDLEKDERAGVLYRVLVDTYKSVFVSYSLDSINGAIYQMHGNTAGVMLRRGEYDWRPVTGSVPKDACAVSKDLALFLADQWRKQADDAIVSGKSKTMLGDIPDLKALKVIMQRTKNKRARKDNKVALSVIKRMVDEGEQVLAALHAEDKALELIERGDINDVSKIPVSFLGLEDDEGNKMAAVFTSMDEIGEIDGEDIEAVPLSTLLRFIKHMDRLDGMIIDPFSDRFLVTKEKIAEMLDDISAGPIGM